MNVLNLIEAFGAVQVAVLGYVAFMILMQPGHLLDFHKKRLEWWVFGGTYFTPPERYKKIEWRAKLSNPVGGCAICSTGQLSFWVYTFSNLDGLSPLRLFLFTALSIFTIKILDKWQSS